MTHNLNCNLFQLLILCVSVTNASEFFSHAKQLKSSCKIPLNSFLSNHTQYTITKHWSRSETIYDWTISKWNIITLDNDAKIFHKYKIKNPNQLPVRHQTLHYTTKTDMPQILNTLFNVNMFIKVEKQTIIVGNVVHTYVTIKDVPLVDKIQIQHTANLLDTKIIKSEHFISYGNIPWYAKWASNILRKEIIKSLDDYDDQTLCYMCTNMYCF